MLDETVKVLNEDLMPIINMVTRPAMFSIVIGKLIAHIGFILQRREKQETMVS